MASRPESETAGQARRRSAPAVLETPLRPIEFVWLASALTVAGTIYCALYCLIAFSPMHGHVMPLSYSATWAVFTFLPWLAAIELAKRSLARMEAGLQWLWRCVALAAGALLLSMFVEQGADIAFAVETRPLTMQAADRLAPLLITSALFALLWRSRKMAKEPQAPDVARPLPDSAQWFRAAGNYVEIHCDGRLHLHRLTMRELEARLDPRRFVRIHRSAIVNRDDVASIGPGPVIHMRDGSAFRIGHAYRRSLDRLR